MYEELSEMEVLFSWAAVGRGADVHSKGSQVTENPVRYQPQRLCFPQRTK